MEAAAVEPLKVGDLVLGHRIPHRSRLLRRKEHLFMGAQPLYPPIKLSKGHVPEQEQGARVAAAVGRWARVK